MKTNLVVAGCLALAISIALLAPSLASERKPMAVVSYNIRCASPNDGDDVWPNRQDTVIAFLQNFDIFGLQEATPKQVQAIKQGSPSHACYSVGRKPNDQGEACPIFYRTERLEKIAQGTFWLSPSPGVAGSRGWDAALPRIASWIRLKDRPSGRTWFVMNTHFDHRGARAREESGRLIVKKLSELAQGDPVILMGDFNCLAGDAPYVAIHQQPIAGGIRLRDVTTIAGVSVKGPGSTWNGFQEIVPGRRIDFIFVAGDIKVNGYETMNPKTPAARFASDHLPVSIVAW